MEIFIIVVLILLNGFFALSEIAIVSSKRNRLEHKKIEGDKRAVIALKLYDNSEGFLSAIQVGITLIGIVTGVYGGMNIADDVTPFFQKISIIQVYAKDIALIITVLCITYVSIVIGELVPKVIALSNPDKIALIVAPSIYYFSRAFHPFVWALTLSTNFISKLIGINRNIEQITETELRQMIKTASKEGVIEKEQNIMHEKVFYFSEKKAKHIMTHRTDVEWVDLSRNNDEIQNTLLKAQHSRLVCSFGNIDNIKGVLNIKDFYRALYKSSSFNIQEIVQNPLIVFENVSAQKVLTLLKEEKTHICFVVNEYGSFEGIITLYDVFENIVGHVSEGEESNEPDIFVREDQSVLVSGEAPIEILSEIISGFTVDFEDIDYATIAGFVYNQINRIPQIGDKFEFMGYMIEIMDVDLNKIDKVLITRIQEGESLNK